MDPLPNPVSIAALEARFGIPGRASVTEGNGGLPKVTVRSPPSTGELYLRGGQVTSWVPTGSADVLFVSAKSRWEPGRAIRGGIPICFPWFGAKTGVPDAPSHGFVRLRDWHLEAIEATANAVSVLVRTESDAGTRAHWPADFELELAAIFGASLHLSLSVVNTGADAFSCEEALHTYFAAGDVRRTFLRGLDGVHFLDKVGGGSQLGVQAGDIHFTAETDRIYLDTADRVEIHDTSLGRRIEVDKSESLTTVVWNPWVDRARALPDFGDDEWTGMICVETCNVGGSAVTVAPGQRHTMTATIRVGG